MKFAETIASVVLAAVVLFYLFNGNNTASVINAIGTQSTGFVGALMGRAA